jgi:predicted GNAT family acetyltransferase
MNDIRHNVERHRFEATIGGRLAVLDYQENGNRIVFTHTEVPSELRGQGFGGALAKVALDYAAQQQLQVIPACSFIAAYVARNSQYEHLLAASM